MEMPAHVRVGEDVSFTITVHNLGHGAAHGVQLHETPPAGMRIVSVANHGSSQANRTAVWHLGSIAPGESRTVRGTLRVTRTGLHVNTAVAIATNSEPAVSDAAVRARGTPPVPPSPIVTG
ncbi:MAG TPA: DUF11 domain-containing protein [Solirubrobacteraceae bacterium]|nr:DUF11 domain-containing protein [Solirubrobacteraceae bacterium]